MIECEQCADGAAVQVEASAHNHAECTALGDGQSALADDYQVLVEHAVLADEQSVLAEFTALTAGH